MNFHRAHHKDPNTLKYLLYSHCVFVRSNQTGLPSAYIKQPSVAMHMCELCYHS